MTVKRRFARSNWPFSAKWAAGGDQNYYYWVGRSRLEYRATVAQWKAERTARRRDRRWARAWSPEQIAHRLPLDSR